MPNPPDQQPRSRGAAAVLRWGERLLVIAGAALLVWCAVLIIDARLSQRVARRSLEIVSIPDVPVLAPPSDAATDVSPREPTVSGGSAIAALSIPRIHLSAVVLHGSDAQTLRRGPGHLEHTALPGESGNVAIAGHRDTFFWPLRNIRLGDDIFLDTPHERFHYEVTSLQVVNPHDVSVLEPTEDSTLTLITCYPFWVLGNAPDRFVVRATRVGKAAAAIESRTLSPLDLIHVPVLAQTAVSESVFLPTETADSDETLVRQAVERYRLALNARLMTCDVAVTDDRATATCAAVELPSDEDTHDRTFMLERTDGGWAIRSIVLTSS